MKITASALTTAALGCSLLCACDSPTASLDKRLVEKTLFEQQIGEDKVYGLALRFTTDQDVEATGVAIRLEQEDQSFHDTLYLELKSGDTVDTEVVFGQAVVSPSGAEASVEFFEL